jgi:hypothetical protein
MDAYLSAMRSSSAWGGLPELAVISRRWQCCIEIYDPAPANQRRRRAHVFGVDGDPVRLSFDGIHYDSLDGGTLTGGAVDLKKSSEDVYANELDVDEYGYKVGTDECMAAAERREVEAREAMAREAVAREVAALEALAREAAAREAAEKREAAEQRRNIAEQTVTAAAREVKAHAKAERRMAKAQAKGDRRDTGAICALVRLPRPRVSRRWLQTHSHTS